MGFLANLFGRGERRYHTRGACEANVANQARMAPQTVAQLRQLGVTATTQLELEVFFYTDAEPKAAGLDAALARLGYRVRSGPSASGEGRFLVTGWTTRMRMDEAVVVGWTRQMCELGYEHDCEFDGWGTNPDQEQDD